MIAEGEKEIRFTDFKTVDTNYDEEDLTEGQLVQAVNIRPYRGRLVKTFGMGVKLDDTMVVTGGAGAGFFGLDTYFQDNLNAGGYIYLLIKNYGSATYGFYPFYWNSGADAWYQLELHSGIASGHTCIWEGTIKHSAAYNPIVQRDKTMRFLPGNITDGVRVWFGRISRSIFDEGYTPAAGFYGLNAAIVAPVLSDLSLSFIEVQGGTFNSLAENNWVVTDTSCSHGTITVAGDVTSIVQKGDYIRLRDNTEDANNQAYLVKRSIYDGANDKTIFEYDSTFSALTSDADDDGWAIPLIGAGEYLYYKFSYIYDGIQESLLSDPFAVNLHKAGDVMPKIDLTVDKTAINVRITAMNIYRCNLPTGDYKLVQTIDFLRKAADVLQAANTGLHSGLKMAYVPALADYAYGAGAYLLYIQDKLSWKVIGFSGTPTIEDCPEDDTTYYDFVDGDLWDRAWYLTKDGSRVASGDSGAYAGENCFINPAGGAPGLFGEHDAAGGILFADYSSDSPTSKEESVASVADGTNGLVTMTTAQNHYLEEGDQVELHGFDPQEQYNGLFTVIDVPSDTTFKIQAYWNADDTGRWRRIGRNRIILDNYKKAIHVSERFNWSQENNSSGWGYKMVKPQKGNYFLVISGDNATYTFYDNGLIEGKSHALQGEVSINTEGACAVVINKRLFQGDILLDPTDKQEAHDDWGAYSEFEQVDVNPVSNVVKLEDREGGRIMGLAELFGDPIYLKKRAVIPLYTDKGRADPATWYPREINHNIGLIAKRGYISILGALYIAAIEGIYRLYPNNLAESDATPTRRLLISEPIANTWNAMTYAQKEAVKCSYDQYKNEILFALQFTQDAVDEDQVWAFNINTQEWRQIDIGSAVIGLFGLDHEAQVMAWNSTAAGGGAANKVLSIGTPDSNERFKVRIPYQRISHVRKEVVRWMVVTYQCACPLQLKCYADHSDTTPLETIILPSHPNLDTEKVRVNIRAKKFAAVITDEDTTNLAVDQGDSGFIYLAVALTGVGTYPNTEITDIRILHD